MTSTIRITYMSCFRINKRLHHNRLTLTRSHHTVCRRYRKHTLADVRIFGLGHEVEVRVAATLVRHLHLTHSTCLVLQVTEVDTLCAQRHLHRLICAFGLLQLTLHTQTGFLHDGLVVVLDLDVGQSKDGLVVTSAELHHMVIGHDLHILRRNSLTRSVKNTIAPSRGTAFLTLLLIVGGGVLLVLVGRRELDVSLDELFEGKTGTLRDLQLIFLEEVVDIAESVVEDLESRHIGGNTVVEITNLNNERKV